MSEVRARRWCFTLNNYEEHGWENWQQKLVEQFELLVEYLVCEEEVGEQGTSHLQGYIKFRNQMRFTTLQQKFNGAAHLEVARGTDEDNRNYCTKDNGNIFEIGKPNERTICKKNDWKKLVDDYCSMDFTLFRVRYPKESLIYLNKLQQMASVLKESEGYTEWNGDLTTKNYWIYGPPRTGKTKWARSQSTNLYHKLYSKWWKSNMGHPDLIIIEDFPCFQQTNGALGQHIKLWADRYTFTAEYKGGHTLIHPKDYILIVTSNYSIDECFSPGDVEAIKSRFKEVMILEKNDIFFHTKLDIPKILGKLEDVNE